jgi:methionyl-tRNA formyltransferase
LVFGAGFANRTSFTPHSQRWFEIIKNSDAPLKVFLASSSNLAIDLLNSLQASSKVSVVGLITTPDQPKKRSGTRSPNEFAAWVFQNRPAIEIFKPESSTDLQSLLSSAKPDLVVAIAYGKIVKPDSLTLPKLGWLNIHFSLLPKYRGAAPVQRAILDGQVVTGVSIFQMEEGLDTGPIYCQKEFPISAEITGTQLLEYLATEGAELLLKAIDLILGGFKPIDQQGEPSLAPKIAKEELRLDCSRDTSDLIRQIKAFGKRPGCWLMLDGKRLTITDAVSGSSRLSPGLVEVTEDSFLIGTLDGSLSVRSLILEGRREMSGQEFARGGRKYSGQSVE